MPSHEPAHVIAGRRTVTAGAVLAGVVDLRGYPHRYLGILSDSVLAASLTELLAAAELLERWGWEVLTVSSRGHDGRMFAVMRRRT
jgi:hypothetical protein